MAKQAKTQRIPTDSIQGPESFVVVRPPKWGLLRKANKQAKAGDAEAGITFAEELLVKSIVAWNWTDDDDEPYALPKDDPSVLEDLDADEVAFLVEKITGSFSETGGQGN